MTPFSTETLYSGTYFRSRLEARWAVFMDCAGIEWSYEPAWVNIKFPGGVEINWRPDFLLEDGRWVEVKGSLDERAHERLLLIAESVGDVVVLGRIPQDGWHWPVQLHRCDDGELWAVPWRLDVGCPIAGRRPRLRSAGATIQKLLDGVLAGQPEWAEAPLIAARSARF